MVWAGHEKDDTVLNIETNYFSNYTCYFLNMWVKLIIKTPSYKALHFISHTIFLSVPPCSSIIIFLF